METLDINIFEHNYIKHILPKYSQKRDNNYDIYLINNIITNTSVYNKYTKHINNIRTNIHDIDVITIDPPNCTDADDAFSIYEKENKLYLAVHIADPTHYIDIKSNLWNDILNRAVTHYPSNHKPIHMMPDEIDKRSSLMTCNNEEIKNAITVTFEINKNTYLPTNNIKLDFCFNPV